ncbi:MAG TPA: DUF169 domain-containing protein [Syntrophomonas sp.]|nr:DUF169 domain-containing protein [Syntrophomonas sp.]HRW12413.1 DUF169 domain-containing protein [Syntrophomonas sp.]
MQQNKNYAEVLKHTIGMHREPVAVKLVGEEAQLSHINPNDYDAGTKSRYCQGVMRATRGERVILNADNISCAAAAAAFGFKTLHPKLASGEAHFNTGTFGTQEAAQRIMGDMPRLACGDYHSVLISPLALAEFEPDVVLIEAPPENLMWLALACIYTSGERLQFSTSVVQATCVDCTVVPFISGKTNATLGCNGCREATDLNVTENLLGIPYASLSSIIDNLANMKEFITKNRSKSIYERFDKK